MGGEGSANLAIQYNTLGTCIFVCVLGRSTFLKLLVTEEDFFT